MIDRSRDITFSNKTSHDIEVFKITRLIDLVELLYSRMERDRDSNDTPPNIKEIYKDLIENHGAELLTVHKIRELDTPYLLKNADFSKRTIKDLIKQGEELAYQQLPNVVRQ